MSTTYLKGIYNGNNPIANLIKVNGKETIVLNNDLKVNLEEATY